MIIEFYGLPGSGKTHLAWETVEFLRDKGLKVCDVDQVNKYKNSKNLLNLYRQFIFILKNLKLFFIVLNLSKKSKLNFKFRLLRTIIFFKSFYASQKSKKYDYFVFDEGIIQNIWSIIFWSESLLLDGLENVYKFIKLSDDVLPIFLQTDIDQIIKRLNARPLSKRSRFNGQSIELLNDIFKRHPDLFSRLKIKINKYEKSLIVRDFLTIKKHLETRI